MIFFLPAGWPKSVRILGGQTDRLPNRSAHFFGTLSFRYPIDITTIDYDVPIYRICIDQYQFNSFKITSAQSILDHSARVLSGSSVKVKRLLSSLGPDSSANNIGKRRDRHFGICLIVFISNGHADAYSLWFRPRKMQSSGRPTRQTSPIRSGGLFAEPGIRGHWPIRWWKVTTWE